MAFSQSDIDNLKAAIARGARKVKQGDEEIEFTSLADMQKTLRMMQAEVTPSVIRPIATIYPRTGRGL